MKKTHLLVSTLACILTCWIGRAQETQTFEPRLLWKLKSENFHFADPVVSRGPIFVGSDDHTFYALNADDHSVLWSYKTNGQIYGAPLVTDDSVYFESDDRKLYKVSRASGELVWSFEIAGTQPVRDPYIFFHRTTSTPVLKEGKLFFGSGNKDAAMVVTVNPGLYTAVISGNNDGTGVALVEVYEIPDTE